MSRIWQSGFELNSLTSGVEITSSTTGGGGTLTISNSTVRSGTYSLRANNAGANGQAAVDVQFASSTGNGPFYLRTYINIASLPDGLVTICSFLVFSGATRASIRLATDGTLELWDTVKVGSSSAALSLNQWYMLELRYDNTGATLALQARLNGTVFATSTSSSGSHAANAIRIGVGNVNQTAYDIFYDDVALNDTVGAFQASYPGEGKIIHLHPSATGDSNGFLAQVGGTAGAANNFTRVNEVTPDDATSYNGSALLNAEDLFNCDDSGFTPSTRVNVIAVGVRMADLVSADATAAFKLEIEKTSGGTKSQSGTLIPNSTSWLTNGSLVSYPFVTYQDPDGVDWTQITVDSMQIGYIQTAINVQTIAISTVWASVEYLPTSGDFLTFF